MHPIWNLITRKTHLPANIHSARATLVELRQVWPLPKRREVEMKETLENVHICPKFCQSETLLKKNTSAWIASTPHQLYQILPRPRMREANMIKERSWYEEHSGDDNIWPRSGYQKRSLVCLHQCHTCWIASDFVTHKDAGSQYEGNCGDQGWGKPMT